ncbi:MAG: hypothetical protein ACFFBP_03590 [Promethearchaeota archaeon]
MKRFPIDMGIHNLFIFKKSGICLFGKNFTNAYKMEDNLISAFFSAIRSFTQEVVGEKVKTVEMGGIKFTIINKDEYYYGILCNVSENLYIIEDIIEKIHQEYITQFNKQNLDKNLEHIRNPNFDRKIDEIIEKILSTEYDIKKEKMIIEEIKTISQYNEIKGIIFLTNKGRVIYSSLKGNDLRNLLNEVDFRIKIYNNTIIKMYYNSKNGDIILSEYVDDLYYIILLFDKKISFGFAEYYLNKAVKLIKSTLYKESHV